MSNLSVFLGILFVVIIVLSPVAVYFWKQWQTWKELDELTKERD